MEDRRPARRAASLYAPAYGCYAAASRGTRVHPPQSTFPSCLITHPVPPSPSCPNAHSYSDSTPILTFLQPPRASWCSSSRPRALPPAPLSVSATGCAAAAACLQLCPDSLVHHALAVDRRLALEGGGDDVDAGESVRGGIAPPRSAPRLTCRPSPPLSCTLTSVVSSAAEIWSGSWPARWAPTEHAPWPS